MARLTRRNPDNLVVLLLGVGALLWWRSRSTTAGSGAMVTLRPAQPAPFPSPVEGSSCVTPSGLPGIWQKTPYGQLVCWRPEMRAVWGVNVGAQ